MDDITQGFARNFRACCAQACMRLAYQHQQADDRYAAAQQECIGLYRALQEQLAPGDKLLNRFDAAKNRLAALDSEYIYQQGFQDCVYLLRWLGLLQE